MSIVWTIIGLVVALVWVVINVFTTKAMSAKQMHEEFVAGQCLVGKICANIFYAPAWISKGIRCFVLAAIK